jgi:hypothetical protein
VTEHTDDVAGPALHVVSDAEAEGVAEDLLRSKTIMPDGSTRAPRVRLAADVDLGKAKKGCRRCGGSGRVGYATIPMPDQPGGRARVPVICRCVTRRGGVRKDMLDQIMAEAAEQLDSGAFGARLAQDVAGLPPESRAQAVAALQRDAMNEGKDPRVRAAIREALATLGEGVPEGGPDGIL